MIADKTPNIYRELIEKYQSMMYYAALKVVKDKHLAEDIVQEVWIKIIRTKQSIRDITRIGAWLRTITVRTAIDMVRKENARKHYFFEDPSLMEELAFCPGNEVEAHINWMITLKELEKCLLQNNKLMEVFQLKFKKEYNDKEIADQLGISLSAVKSRLFRARKLLIKYKEKEKMKVLKPGA